MRSRPHRQAPALSVTQGREILAIRLSLNDCRALRPVIQKYDKPDFVKQLLADPSTYLKWDEEVALPMWRLPPSAARGEAGQTLSLWFGTVSTYSSEFGLDGNPKLNDKSIYRIRCFVRQNQGNCPPRISWSEQSVPFRLASFFDPQGTKNHKVAITMPDLRSLQAQAGSGMRPQGVRITTPAGSGLVFDSDVTKLNAGAGSLSPVTTGWAGSRSSVPAATPPAAVWPPLPKRVIRDDVTVT
jgi:hypothetical protein